MDAPLPGTVSARVSAAGASPGRPDPRVSVIVPTWNEASALPSLLESLRRQTVREFEVIVADSGSTDGTQQVAAAFDARFLPGQRKGPAEGRNRGARAARTDTLVFVDADCLLPPQLLESILSALDDPAVVGGATLFRPIDGTAAERTLFFLASAYQKAMNVWGYPHNAGFCFFFRGSAFQRLAGLREDLFLNETHDIALRSRSIGGFVNLPVYVATSTRRFRKHGFARTVLHEYLGSTLLYYVARHAPPASFQPEPVR
ncbi:MAG TPA: glycosyltransferase [Thermoplasmata archaeon]|nr:glycosyltransferase [Thermoplasmata archaeon]